MFDFGFWELAIVMVVALLVVGPERLPALAGQLGKWVGKARKMVASVRSDIESEIKSAELKEILEKQQGEIGELKEMLKSTQNEPSKHRLTGPPSILFGNVNVNRIGRTPDDEWYQVNVGAFFQFDDLK